MGNLTAAATEALTARVEAIRARAGTQPWIPGGVYTREIPAGGAFVREEVMNPESLNRASCVFWQVPSKYRAEMFLLEHCLDEYLYNSLRTRQQLGYIVWSIAYTPYGSNGLVVIVQSNSVRQRGHTYLVFL